MDQHLGLFICGDVMTGRGIDQILPHPGDPHLFEPYVRDARDYLRLAEAAHGPIPYPVSPDYIWGDALEELDRAVADVRLVNLETSITTSEDYWPDKEVHYRMHPQNIGCLKAAGIDCCALANNHVLDWGYTGLAETLATLNEAGIRHAGAGMNTKEAEAPAVFEVTRKGRVLVFSFGSVTSGIPLRWAAAQDRPGVNLLGDLSQETSHRIAAQMQDARSPGDTAIASIHWGGNWGYDIPEAQIRFAHRLIDEGVDLVYGHSSHHAKAIEVYQGCPIFYGCGDFLTDYEGIRGYEAYRGNLAVMYLITLDPSQSGSSHSPCNDVSGRCMSLRGAQRRNNFDPQDSRLLRCARNDMLIEVRLIPMQVRHFRLNRALATDAQWLHRMLNREGTPFGTMISLNADNSLTVQLP